MKIFLANPTCRIKLLSGKEKYFVRAGSRWPFSTEKKVSDLPDYLPFPFFLAYTAAILEKKGHQVLVDDGVALNETESQLLAKIQKNKPNIFLFETSTPTINFDLNLVKKIKQKFPKTLICLAGAHATVFPKEILAKNKAVDFIFLAEYEINFCNFVESLSSKKKTQEIEGLAFRSGPKIIINKAKAIEELDILPFPARHLFPSNEKPDPYVYWDGFCQYQPSVQMQASRGCPFRCNFCLWNQVIFQNGKYRVFSAKRIVDEMQQAVEKYSVKEIYFDDDTFTANKVQVLAICSEIIKRKLKVYWSVMGDAMITDKQMISQMSKAGCVGIKFGVESGNKDILKIINKPIDFQKVKKFVGWCAEFKIKTHATFTFGLQEETKQTMRQTLYFAKSLDVDSVQFSLTTPFPGTRYFDQLKKEGLLKKNNWEEFDGSSSSVVNFKNFSQKEIVSFYSQASGKWLLSKIKDTVWLKRQIYFLRQQAKSNGSFFVLKKLVRGISLIVKVLS